MFLKRFYLSQFFLSIFVLSNSSGSSRSQPTSAGQQNVATQQEVGQKGLVPPMRILALFSGTTNDLGIDHRLGRQVLKLATNRAKQLYQELADIELEVQNDDTECSSLNIIPSRVAQQFYLESSGQEECGKYVPSATTTGAKTNSKCSPNQDEFVLKELNSFLNESNDEKEFTNGSNGSSQRRSRGVSMRSRSLESNDNASRSTPTKRRIDAIIGPSCNFLVDLVARMAAYWRTPIYSVTSIDASFAQKDIYSSLTRLSPSIDHLSMFLVKAMEKFRWRHMAIIVDTKQVENTILLENLERTISRVRYMIAIERKTFAFNSFREQQNETINLGGNDDNYHQEARSRMSSSSLCTKEASELLLGARKVARVFLLLLNDHQVVRRLLLCAYELNMNNGEFTFLALSLGLKSSQAVYVATTTTPSAGDSGGSGDNLAPTKSRSTSSRTTQNLDWYSADDEHNNLKAKQMFESLMVFSVELPMGDEYNIFVEQTLDMTHQEYPEVRFERSSVGPVAVALHDSLLLCVEAYMRRYAGMREYQSTTMSDNNNNNEHEEDVSDGEDTRQPDIEQVPLMWNEHYSSGLITNMHINSNGDQELDYVLSDLEPEMGLMRPVASYSKDSRQIQLLPSTYIHWPRRVSTQTKELLDNDEPPADEPECGFNDDADRCIDRQNLYAALSILVILALLVLLSTSISLHKYRQIKYQMKLDDHWWKINWNDLQFIQRTDSMVSSAQSVARVLKMGGSVVSMRSDGEKSMVSMVHDTTSVKNKKKIKALLHMNHESEVGKEEEGKKEESSKGAKKPRVANNNKRRSAVPLIVTSTDGKIGDDKVSSGGSSQHLTKRNDTTNMSVHSEARSNLAGTCIIRSEYSSLVRASNLAMYKKELVIVKQLNGRTIDVSHELLVELKSMREHVNDNLAKFVGLCVEPERLAIVYEYCSRGSLQDMLLNESIAMDWTLKYSIIGDIVSGLNFIHSTLIDYHGRLKSTNLVLDSRFTVKITDFGLQNLYSQLEAIKDQEEDEEEDEDDDDDSGLYDDDGATTTTTSQSRRRRNAAQMSHDQMSLSVSQSAYNMESVSVRGGDSRKSEASGRMRLKNRGAARYFWTAPEHLRDKNQHCVGSKKGDVYSLAIILFEIFTRKEPYYYGTNAKPRWFAIKRDCQMITSQQKQQHQLNPAKLGRGFGGGRPSRGTAASEVSAGISQVSGSVGRQIKRRAQNKLKRNSVNPEREQSSIDKTDTVSIVSASAQSLTSIRDAQEPALGQVVNTTATPHPHRTVRLSVTAIEEEEEGVAVEGTDEPLEAGTVAASAVAGKEKRINVEEILDQLRMGIQPEPVRPYVPNYVTQEVSPKLIELMRSCWSESPSSRPTLTQVRNQLRRITKGIASKNYLDNLLDRLQNYAANLERIVDSKSSDIVAEKYRTEELLYQLLPKFVADRLKRNEPIVPQVFDGVTIFFSDIVGFEKYASVMSPSELVDLLNNIYSSFESIISSFDVTKIETIIDQFLVASGISLHDHESTSQGAAMGRPITSDQMIAKPATEKDMAHQGIVGTGATGTGGVVGRSDSGQPSEGKRGKFKKSKLLSSLGRSTHSSTDEKTKLAASANGASLDTPTDDIAEVGGSGPILTAEEKHRGLDMNRYRRSSAEQIARMALCIRDLVKSFHFRQNLSSKKPTQIENNNNTSAPVDHTTQPSGIGSIVATTFNIRIGIHSGKVCAGIVGVKRPKFCLIGDTVNVASRMHTNSKANRIQISGDTKVLLDQVPGFSIEPRGKIEVKGKGMMETFWLESSY